MANIKISSLPVGAADPNAILIVNNAGNTQTQRVTAGAIAALSGPVHTVAGRSGAVVITSSDLADFNAAAASVAVTAAPVLTVAGRSGTVALTSGDLSDFSTAVAVIAGTTGPVASVNGATGAVSINATSVGAAPASHSHNSTAVTDFVTAVATGERWATVTINNNVISTVADVYRLTAGTTSEVRGITNAVRDGATRCVFININVNNVTFVHNHSTDSAAFLCPGGVNFSLGENEWAFGKYDPTSQRWRVTPNCCGGT